MDTIIKVLIIALTATVVENTIFSKALGTSTMLIVAKNKKQIFGFGVCMIYICTISSALTYFVDKLFLNNESSFLYMPLLYVIIIGFVYIVTLLALWKWAYKLFKEVKKFVHISAFNFAVLGALFLNSTVNDTFIEYVGFGLGTGFGFLLATYLVSVSFDKLTSENVPESFKGFPIMLIFVGIISMAFYALGGFQTMI